MFQAILTSLIVGSLFYQLGVEEYTLKLGLFLYVATSLAFSNFAEVPLAAEYKKVLYKQIDAGFYPTTSYLTSLIIVHLPLAFAEVLLLGSIVYWMAGTFDLLLHILVVVVSFYGLSNAERSSCTLLHNRDS